MGERGAPLTRLNRVNKGLHYAFIGDKYGIQNGYGATLIMKRP
jgi:hypothetical protein